jgi:nucleotide-binding universal stress UspA family protein
MAATINQGWSKSSTILFASEFPANEKAFAFALAQAAEFGSDLVILHVYDSVDIAAQEASAISSDVYVQSSVKKQCFEPLVQRAGNLGVHCSIVIRPGQAAVQILAFLRERRVDQVVMGTHSPGPIGKLLVGSVAEEVLRNSPVPVNIVGPNVVEGAYRHFSARTILCSVDAPESSRVVARFAAELAARHKASLILQHVIPPQVRDEILAGRTLGQIEAELPSLVPSRLQHKVGVRTRAVLGDPTEELLYQGRALRASMIVIGAQGASQFAAITRAGIVYKVLAYAQCPVITLSPIVLARFGAGEDHSRHSDLCLAGVF